MGFAANLVRRWIEQVGLMGWPARVAALSLAGLIVGGLVWMSLPSVSQEYVPLEGVTGNDSTLGSLRGALRAKGIDSREQDGRLAVAGDQVEKAQGIVKTAFENPSASAPSLAELAGSNDIWCTQSQADKRWQAAKMALLSKLIGEFPAVRSATVLYEPGSPRKLGAPGVEPTAAVNVALKPDCEMGPRLVEAIADLVAGSIPGMSRQNVHVIDSVGKSYRVSHDRQLAAIGQLERQRQAEAYYLEKIRSSLGHVGPVVAGVHVQTVEGGERCVSASVSVPQSYLLRVLAAQTSPGAMPSGTELGKRMEAQLGDLAQAVMNVLGLSDPRAVKVDWYPDVTTCNEASVGPGDDWKGSLACPPWGWVGVAAGACLLMASMVVLLRRRRGGDTETVGGSARTAMPAESAERPLAVLNSLGEDELQALVGMEHPQTLAVVLAHLTPGRAASLLAGLAPQERVETVRRLADLEPIDPAVLGEIEAGLCQRLGAAGAGAAPVGGATRVAQILQHAGLQAGQAVLDELASAEPALAESIRSRIFAFEDVLHVPTASLRRALGLMDMDDLAMALRTSGDEIRQRFYGVMPSRSARALRQQIDGMGPIRLGEVEDAQRRVVDAVCRAGCGQYVSDAQEALAGERD